MAQTIAEILMDFHHPEFVAKPENGDGHYVCEVWEDGEITLTKGGSLYGMRGLHQIVPPLSRSLPLDDMPRLNGSKTHGNVVCRYDDCRKLRAIIAAALDVDDPYSHEKDW